MARLFRHAFGSFTSIAAGWDKEQGSLHDTPEHCLVNGGFPFVLVSNGCNMYLLRSPEEIRPEPNRQGTKGST